MAEQDQNHGTIPDIIPASMLAAFAYCPRLCYLQWAQGEHQDSAETVDGRFRIDGSMPERTPSRRISSPSMPVPSPLRPRRREFAAGSICWREMAAESLLQNTSTSRHQKLLRASMSPTKSS